MRTELDGVGTGMQRDRRQNCKGSGGAGRGVWCVVCGVWCVVCGVWSVVCVLSARPRLPGVRVVRGVRGMRGVRGVSVCEVERG